MFNKESGNGNKNTKTPPPHTKFHLPSRYSTISCRCHFPSHTNTTHNLSRNTNTTHPVTQHKHNSPCHATQTQLTHPVTQHKHNSLTLSGNTNITHPVTQHKHNSPCQATQTQLTHPVTQHKHNSLTLSRNTNTTHSPCHATQTQLTHPVTHILMTSDLTPHSQLGGSARTFRRILLPPSYDDRAAEFKYHPACKVSRPSCSHRHENLLDLKPAES